MCADGADNAPTQAKGGKEGFMDMLAIYYSDMSKAERRKWSKAAVPVIDCQCPGGSLLESPHAFMDMPLQRCIHKVGRLKVQRWLSRCFERWNRCLKLKWPKQGMDVVVDRCLRRLTWASREVQPAATASMLRVLGNWLPFAITHGAVQEVPIVRLPTCGIHPAHYH
eukprot:4184038-Amphidinium_carterae.2